MEVKSIYLDLQKAELTKKGKKSVWKLESEAFKEPLELTIGYDDQELKEFERKYDSLYKAFLDIEKELDLWNTLQVEDRKALQNMKELIETEHKNIESLVKFLSENESEIKSLYKVIADANTTIETQSGTILHLWDRVKELEKKATKQPMVYSDKTFISGHERCGLTMIEIPSGEYLLISKYVIWEHNEFVTNRNDVVMEKITVNDNCYIPMYQLVGWTDLDTPTATIYRTLTFIPC